MQEQERVQVQVQGVRFEGWAGLGQLALGDVKLQAANGKRQR